ncbi:unnamed protein product [Agarophyton chilense]
MDASFKPHLAKTEAGELAFSAEDTNRVRLALGLRPLTTSDQATHSIPALQTITKNGEISCSVAETNKLRASLGLRPLRTRQPSQPSVPGATRQARSEDEHALERRLQKARAARAARNVMAPLSISEQIVEIEARGDSLSTRKRAAAVKKRKRDDCDLVQLPPRLENELGPGQHQVLTLRDNHVLQDDSQPQLLQRVEKAGELDRDSDEDSEHNDIDGMNYDGTDTVQFQKEPPKPKNAMSHNIERKDLVADEDFDRRPTFSKRKRSRRKRKRVAEDAPITKGHLKALRKKEQQKNGDESENDDDYFEKMLAARRKSKRDHRDRIAKQILDRVDHSESDNEEKAVVTFSEMDQFSVGAPVDEKDQQQKPSEAVSNSSGDARGETANQSPVQTGTVFKLEKVASNNLTETRRPAVSISSSVPTAEEVKPSEMNGMTGLAATLKRLRQTGALHRKPEQVGRARDKRYNDSDEESVQHGKARVKLSYTDEFGNKLTPKEAYRLLSHKFHGNAPKQNKKEKRLQRMLEEKNHPS